VDASLASEKGHRQLGLRHEDSGGLDTACAAKRERPREMGAAGSGCASKESAIVAAMLRGAVVSGGVTKKGPTTRVAPVRRSTVDSNCATRKRESAGSPNFVMLAIFVLEMPRSL
jgi:hypothetical protein